MNEKVAIDDAKALLISYECRLERRNDLVMLPLSLVNLKSQMSIMKHNPLILKCLKARCLLIVLKQHHQSSI